MSQSHLSGFKMTWVSLQMVILTVDQISLGSLLIFTDRTSSSSPDVGSSRCVGKEEVRIREERFLRTYWAKLNVPPPRYNRTCAETVRELHGGLSNRSLSPWTYSLDQDVDRVPHEIALAKCLCQGCIIDQREDLSFNSVPVFAPLMVLRKTRCPSDSNKQVVKKDFIKVPVACTCAVPKFVK